jgi:hypothetical protein
MVSPPVSWPVCDRYLLMSLCKGCVQLASVPQNISAPLQVSIDERGRRYGGPSPRAPADGRTMQEYPRLFELG